MRYTGKDYTYEEKRKFCIKEINFDGFLSKETLQSRINGLHWKDLARMVMEGSLCVLSNHCYDIPEKRDKRLYWFRHSFLMWCDNCNRYSFRNRDLGVCQNCKCKSALHDIFPMSAYGEYR